MTTIPFFQRSTVRDSAGYYTAVTIRAMSESRPPLSNFLGPRYWPTWLLLGLVRLLCLLPYRPLMAVGRLLGRAALPLLAERRHIALRNIEKCRPELDDPQRKTLLKKHFESLGMAVFETGLAWWAKDARLAPLCHAEGTEYLHAALEKGRGAIMLSAHFTCLEICSRMLAMQVRLNPVYRRFRNPLLQEVMQRGRERSTDSAIPKEDLRQIVRTLKKNGVVWYAPDQSHSGKGAQIVPFFKIPAQTNTATTRLARMTGAPVLPFLPWRMPDGSGYRIVIGAEMDKFPSDDEIADTKLFHRMIEEHVQRVPEQYLWIHRRFKNVPENPDFYA
ncbi:MAG: LpxL/LpxP family Kdo(2)-lipid IV(A) lauroyl/palmitoleoyl acyltransferase [Gammaproteobacteria bacterium]|nr:LpxL/LpxP family Kdo(2)-lipid IV(A) lauroyl/palmitoleoyl acyltransferase [Gammaproteobacteria bacterium]